MSKIYTQLLFLFFGVIQIYPQGSGKALELDGSDDYVLIPYHSSFDFSAGTIEAWLCPTASSDNEVFLAMRTASGGARWSAHINESSNWIGIASSTTPYRTVSVTEGITAGKWIHIAIYLNTASCSVYVNGTYRGATLYGFASSYTGVPLTIGLHESDSWTSERYPGKIDEVRIWNDQRSLSEIQENMCKSLVGDEAGLIAYYKMTDGSGTTLTDNSSSGRTGTLTYMDDSDWITSGAAIGDASISNYSSPSSVNLASGNGDDLTVNSITGSPSGVQIYRVDEAPNVTTPPGSITQLSQVNYFGVFIAGGTSPTYTLTYNYDGHPGITNEASLDLAKRDNNSTTSWTEGNATLNTTANTLTLTGQTGTEYILGSESSNPLPVELTSFTANVLNNKVTLNWNTATEKDNFGFEIQRSAVSGQLSDWENIGFVNGHGNSNSPKVYSFVDDKVTSSGNYFYRLKQIDTDGSYEYSKIVEVDFGQPNKFELKQNYPNPFNPRTVISYQLSTPDNVTLKIYDVLGNEVAVLVDNEWQEAGKYNYQFSPDASGFNYQFSSGLYFYQLRAGDFVQVKKMILAK